MGKGKAKEPAPKAEIKRPRTVDGESITILEIQQEQLHVYLVGTEPIICNRVSEKAARQLLLPSGKKDETTKRTTLKHVPLDEFRASPYTLDNDRAPTLLAALSVWFKKSMMVAALDTPGVKKAQIGRLVRVEGERIPMFGIPELRMDIVRSADIGRTPDVRTRATVRQWAVALTITYPTPLLRQHSVQNLLAIAGKFSGAGDGRTEKGWGNYGSFRLASVDDPELKKILATGGRAAQIEAMNVPKFYDDETEALFNWYMTEVAERGMRGMKVAK